MSIKTACTACGTLFSFPDSALGKMGRCKSCGTSFKIGQPKAKPAAMAVASAAKAPPPQRAATAAPTRQLAKPAATAPRVPSAAQPVAGISARASIPARAPANASPVRKPAAAVHVVQENELEPLPEELPPEMPQLEQLDDLELVADGSQDDAPLELKTEPTPVARRQPIAPPVVQGETLKDMKSRYGGLFDALGPFASQQAKNYSRMRLSPACLCCGGETPNVYQFHWRGRASKAGLSPWTLLTMFAGRVVVRTTTRTSEFSSFHRLCTACGNTMNFRSKLKKYGKLGGVGLLLLGIAAVIGAGLLNAHGGGALILGGLGFLMMLASPVVAIATLFVPHPNFLRQIAPRPFALRKMMQLG